MCFLVGSAALTAYAEIMARVQKCPTTLFIVAGSIPLIPGGALYRTMSYAINKDWQAFFNQGLETLLLAVAISAGILIVMVFDQRFTQFGCCCKKRLRNSANIKKMKNGPASSRCRSVFWRDIKEDPKGAIRMRPGPSWLQRPF